MSWRSRILTLAVGLLVLVAALTLIQRDQQPPHDHDLSVVAPSAGPVTPAGATVKRFPDASNTGVPRGTALTHYDGPCTITRADTVLDALDIQCDRLVVAAEGVVVTRSKVSGVDVDGTNRAVVIEDSTIDAGSFVGPAVGYGDLTLRRLDIRGGQHSVLCGDNCIVEDSWLHDQSLPTGEDRHNNAYLSNGGSDVVISGNTLDCAPRDNAAGGGCSADLSLFGDFAAVTNVTITGNLFKSTPAGYCLRLGNDDSKRYGRKTRGIKVTHNTFERGKLGSCASFGPVTSVPLETQFANNAYEDGATVSAR